MLEMHTSPTLWENNRKTKENTFGKIAKIMEEQKKMKWRNIGKPMKISKCIDSF